MIAGLRGEQLKLNSGKNPDESKVGKASTRTPSFLKCTLYSLEKFMSLGYAVSAE